MLPSRAVTSSAQFFSCTNNDTSATQVSSSLSKHLLTLSAEEGGLGGSRLQKPPSPSRQPSAHPCPGTLGFQSRCSLCTVLGQLDKHIP